MHFFCSSFRKSRDEETRCKVLVFSGAPNRNHMTPRSASLNYKRMKPSPLHLEKTLSVNTDRFTAPSSNPELRRTAISPKHG